MMGLLENVDKYGVTAVTIDYQDEIIKKSFCYTYTIGLQQTFNHPDFLFVHHSASVVLGLVENIVVNYFITLNKRLECNQILNDCANEQYTLKVSPLNLDSVQNGVFSANRSFYEGIKRGLLMQQLKNKTKDDPIVKKIFKAGVSKMIKNENFIEKPSVYLILWPDENNKYDNVKRLESQYHQEAAVLYLIEKAKFDANFKHMEFSTYLKRKISKTVEKNQSKQENQKWKKISSFINKMNH